jgi:ABC-type nitrate/sulfonate/bicarbonate transport system permease component
MASTPAPPRQSTIGAPARAFISRIGDFASSREQLLLGALGVLVVLAGWQAVTSSGLINPLIFASPVDSARTFVDLFVSGEIYPHLFASGRLLFSGLAAAVITGTIVGFAAGWFRTLRGVLLPHVSLLYSTPSIALMPLFLVFFGLGFWSQFAVVFLLPFFPAYYAAVDAVANTDPNLLKVARSFTASDSKLFRTIILPGSIPLLISGLRIALGKAVTAVIVVELYASAEGLGFFLNFSGLRFKTDVVFAILTLLAVFGLLGSIALHALEQRFDTWRPRAGGS